MAYHQTFTAQDADIDELGHVNNTVWLRWVQDIATAHWRAAAPAQAVERYIWVVIRHEIDYRGNMVAGDRAEGRTWIPTPPVGARFDRCVEFTKDGRVLVSARSTWAILDRVTGRPLRVPADLVTIFLDA